MSDTKASHADGSNTYKHLSDMGDGTHAERVVVASVTTKIRDAAEQYAPGVVYTESRATGDLIFADGNAASASYIVISKDPLTANTSSSLTSIETFFSPYDLALGLHLSQRTYGQEFAVEAVSEDMVPIPADIAISSISQTTTTLSVTTATAHGLRSGIRIGIRGVTGDSRLNYPGLVVATTPTPTTFTATAGPQGTIASLTVGPFAQGFVYVRSTLGWAQDGASMIFENATVSNASFYFRSEAGDYLPSGTITGNHSATINTTASVQAINAALTYSFQPTSEYRFALQPDRAQWFDGAVDSTAAMTSRAMRTQVVPAHDKPYRLRFRAVNLPSFTTVTAQIVSAAKTGTTTATVITATPHGLTTGDFVTLYGARDTVNFANITTAAVVASVVDATTFTVVWGGAVTATTYGGFVSRSNGQQNIQGVSAQVVQSASRTANIVTLVGSAAWTGVLIGDMVNAVGLRDAVSGATIGLDGVYRVRDIQTTSLFLEPVSAPTGNDVGSVNCGGAVIKRTCLRISFARVFEADRVRTESAPRPAGDSSLATPVNVQNTPAVAQSGTWTVGLSASQTLGTLTTLTGGGAAEDAAAGTNPIIVGGVARTAALATTIVAGDAVRDTHSLAGAKVVRDYAVPEATWNYSASLTTATAVPAQAAAGAGLKRFPVAIQAVNNGAAAVDLIVLDGATERWRITLPVGTPQSFALPVELVVTANTALNVNLSAANTGVRVNMQGYTGA